MSKKYAYVDCFEEMKELPLKNPLIRYLGEKAIKKYIVAKFPNSIEEVTYADSPGYYIRIPLIKPLQIEDETYIREVIHVFNEHIEYEDIQVLILNQALVPYKQEFMVTTANNTSLGLFYIQKVLNKAQVMSNKKEKDIRYILIDGPSTDSEYVLDHLCENVNALTLVTDQPKRYEEKLEEIYQEWGLAIQIRNKSLHQKLEGEIIINCSRQYNKLFYCYDHGALLIDFLSSEDALYKTKSRRQDLKIIHQFDAYYKEERWEAEILMGILLNEDRLIKNIYLGGYRYNLKEKIDKVLARYPVKFELRCF